MKVPLLEAENLEIDKSVKSYIIIHGLQKKRNISDLMVSATIFRAGIIFIGQRTFDFQKDLPLCIRNTVPILRFKKLKSCQAFLAERGIKIVGVEIDEKSRNVDTEPFDGSIAFLLGCEVSIIFQKF